MTVLSMLQRVCNRLALPPPVQVVGDAGPQTRSLLALLYDEGRELASTYRWQALTRQVAWNGLPQEEQTGILPADFDRIVPHTFYNRAQIRGVGGPLPPSDYADITSGITSLAFDQFRIRGGQILIQPVPSASDRFVFEYVSNYWVQSDTGTRRAEVATDTDTTVLPEYLHELGLMWRWKQQRGLSYDEDFATYQRAVMRAQSHDGGGRRTLRMNVRHRRGVRGADLQDINVGLP